MSQAFEPVLRYLERVGEPTLFFLTVRMGKIEDKVRALAEDVALGLGVEVDEVNLRGEGRSTLLRVTIDREGGVSLDDCAAMSRDLSALLDVEDPIPGHYTLEVTSPGLDRPLRRPRDYRRSVGQLARVVLREPGPRGNVLVGRIEAADGESVVLRVEGKTEVAISYKDIAKARVEIEF